MYLFGFRSLDLLYGEKNRFIRRIGVLIEKLTMQIDDALISHLEKLARLRLAPEERERLRGDLNNILAMVEKLQELDLDGVEPLTYISEEVNVLRPDRVQGQVSREEALRNAPDTDGTFFRVPKVIQNE